MKLLILAAGYATRLYPLTRTQPKPLLPVAGRPLVDHVLTQLRNLPDLDRAYVVTNARFAGHFEQWAAARRAAGTPGPEIVIVNDGTADEATRLGAIGDMDFVLTHHRVDDELVVVAGDNLFSEPVDGIARTGRDKQVPVLAVYDVGRPELVPQYNALETDAQGRLGHFEEKPRHPRGTRVGIALYYYPRPVVPEIRRYLAEGNPPDQPGRLIQWLYPRQPVYTWPVPGRWFDIGTLEQLEEARRVFGG